MCKKEIENLLDELFDEILFQLSKGNTIDGLKNGRKWSGFEQVKEWKSKFGFQFHIYSNDHFIESKPHFHLVNIGENIDCRIFFDGEVYDCKGKNQLDKRIYNSVKYFLAESKIQLYLIEFWNSKNPLNRVDSM